MNGKQWGKSAVGLRNLLDNVLRHVRALEVLKQPTEFWDTPLVYLITSKLDKEIRKEWERTTASNTMPKFDELTTFLNKKCQILESLNLPVCDHTKVNVKSGNKVSSNQNNGQSSKAFINTQTNISCIVCSESHVSRLCFSTELSFLVLPYITGHIPTHPINKYNLKIPKHIKLSDPDFDQSAEIDVLVGAS